MRQMQRASTERDALRRFFDDLVQGVYHQLFFAGLRAIKIWAIAMQYVWTLPIYGFIAQPHEQRELGPIVYTKLGKTKYYKEAACVLAGRHSQDRLPPTISFVPLRRALLRTLCGTQ